MTLYLPIGTVVTRVNAIDRDGTFPNNQVYYYIKPNSDGDVYFKVNSQTGEISTKAVFDRFALYQHSHALPHNGVKLFLQENSNFHLFMFSRDF